MADRVETPVNLAMPHRQSLWAVVFLALRTLRQIGAVQIALAVGFLIARSPSITLLFLIVALVGVALFAGAALQWWRYTFEVVDADIVVNKGVVSQQTLTIPLDRVQSVSLEQKLLHRMVSLVQVSLDTAGTQTAEFTIDAVDQPVAAALQRAAADHRPQSGPSESVHADSDVDVDADAAAASVLPPPEHVVLAHSPRRVVQIALTQMPFAGLVVLAPLFAVAQDLGNYVPFDLPDFDEPTVGWWIAWLVPAVLLFGLLLSMALNLIRVLLSDWNLTLRSTAAGLRRDAGLLSTTSVAASVPRIQLIGIRQGILERMASLHTVDLHTIGSVRMAIPGCDVHQVADVRDLALASSDGAGALDRLVAPDEVFLRTRNALIVSALIAAALFWVVEWWGLVIFLRVPLVWFVTRRRVRLRRWGLSSEAVAEHRELFGWRRQELLLRKVNGVSVRQSLFERKRDLATLRLTTAAGQISIGMIPLDVARQTRDHVLHAVETDTRAWM